MSSLLSKLFCLFLVVLPLFAFACSSTGASQDPTGQVLVKVHVLADVPPSGSEYKLKSGQPRKAGVYEFYLKQPALPGSGAFKKIDSIRLKKTGDAEFYGEKRIKVIDGVMCVGYPSTNLIDGKACVEIDQNQDEIEITIHYWETSLGIL